MRGMAMSEAEKWKQAGARIKAARLDMVPKLSIRAAADAAGMSEGWWRQLEQGQRRPAKGIVLPMNAQPGNLVRAAKVVGVSREEILGIVGLEAEPDAIELRETVQGSALDRIELSLLSVQGDVRDLARRVADLESHQGERQAQRPRRGSNR